MHNDPLENAQKAADELRSDTSVSMQETLTALQELRDHVDILIEVTESSL